MKISFIGGGLMAEALIRGILRNGIALPTDVCVGEPLEERRDYLAQQHSIQVTDNNTKAASDGTLLVLAIKPQNLPQVLLELRGTLTQGQVVLSIVAGARIATIINGLNHNAVIRVMPNTPAQIGHGMSLWLPSSHVEPTFREATRSILQTLGKEIEVHDEKQLDMATALSASGPAYVFLFIESLIDAGVYMGMSRDMARTLVLQTILGSTKLTEETGKHPAELRDMVTSPGGTTAEALRQLEEQGFRAAVLSAVAAAYEKSVRLGSEQ